MYIISFSTRVMGHPIAVQIHLKQLGFKGCGIRIIRNKPDTLHVITLLDIYEMITRANCKYLHFVCLFVCLCWVICFQSQKNPTVF